MLFTASSASSSTCSARRAATSLAADAPSSRSMCIVPTSMPSMAQLRELAHQAEQAMAAQSQAQARVPVSQMAVPPVAPVPPPHVTPECGGHVLASAARTNTVPSAPVSASTSSASASASTASAALTSATDSRVRWSQDAEHIFIRLSLPRGATTDARHATARLMPAASHRGRGRAAGAEAANVEGSTAVTRLCASARATVEMAGRTRVRAVVLSRVLARSASRVHHRVVELIRPRTLVDADTNTHASNAADAAANTSSAAQLELELKIAKETPAVWPFLFLEDDPRLLAQMRSKGQNARACASAFSSSSDSEDDTGNTCRIISAHNKQSENA